MCSIPWHSTLFNVSSFHSTMIHYIPYNFNLFQSLSVPSFSLHSTILHSIPLHSISSSCSIPHSYILLTQLFTLFHFTYRFNGFPFSLKLFSIVASHFLFLSLPHTHTPSPSHVKSLSCFAFNISLWFLSVSVSPFAVSRHPN